MHFNIRLEDERLCTLVMVGARADGTKEVIAVEDGYRESTESWLTLLRDLKKRGMQAPVVAVGDGALGFWKAVAEVWPETKEQRCWFHRFIASAMCSTSCRSDCRRRPSAPWMRSLRSSSPPPAPMRRKAIETFVAEYEPKYPKAVGSLRRDQDKLLTFFDFPAEHWTHLRTTNPVESPFSTVRLRQRVTKGAGSRTKGLLMAFKLLEMAEGRWRRLNAPHLLPLVRAKVKFVDGVQQERPDRGKAKEAA